MSKFEEDNTYKIFNKLNTKPKLKKIFHKILKDHEDSVRMNPHDAYATCYKLAKIEYKKRKLNKNNENL